MIRRDQVTPVPDARLLLSSRACEQLEVVDAGQRILQVLGERAQGLATPRLFGVLGRFSLTYDANLPRFGLVFLRVRLSRARLTISSAGRVAVCQLATWVDVGEVIDEIKEVRKL